MKAAASLAVALLLAACGDYPLSPVARGSEQTGPIDGLYSGRATLVDAKDATCPPEAVGTLQLGDARLLYPYSTNVTFAAPVGPEGRIHDQVGMSTLDGTLDHGRLTFTVKTPACESSFAFSRIAGF